MKVKIWNIVFKASGVLLIILGIVGIVENWASPVIEGMCMITLGWVGLIANATESKGGE